MDTQSFSDQPYSKQTVKAMHVHQGRPTVTHHLTMYACSLQQEHLTSSFEALFNSACRRCSEAVTTMMYVYAQLVLRLVCVRHVKALN